MKNNKHDHSCTSNTDDVFRTFIGEKVKGVLHGFDFGHSKTILVFDCGWGLCFNSNGSHWVELPRDVEVLMRSTMIRLANAEKETKELLKLTGASK